MNKMRGEVKGEMSGFWARVRQQSLHNKFRMIAAGVVLLMMLMGGASIVLVSSSTQSMQAILDANQMANDLQQAMAAETHSFKAYIQDRGEEARQSYEASAQKMQAALAALPFSYEEIGESRYEIMWTIHSSYERYCTARDRVLTMTPGEDTYISALYEVYSMQEYLAQYCAELTQRVLNEGTERYARESAFYLRLPYWLLVIVVAGLLALLGLLYTALGSLFRGLSRLAMASHSIEQNIFTDPDLAWEVEDEMGALVRAFNKMKHATEENLMMQQRLHEEELNRVRLEKRFADAQFRALKNQLNPHFLFNTLNTIARMARLEHAPTSERMTIAVSNLLRYNLRTTAPLVPLSQELKVVQDYLFIQEMRFGDRIRYELNCHVEQSALVPGFLLQPLVENAIQHGLSGTENGGTIRIRVRRVRGRIHVIVADDGMGMSSERLEQIRLAMRQGDNDVGIGLCNLERRIKGLYEDGRACVYSSPGKGTSILIEFGTPKAEYLAAALPAEK